MSTIPLVMGKDGPVATSADAQRQTLIDNVAATNPDYTANLPGSLIEDISSTDVAAITQIDQARVDAVNSITPYGANAYVLAQMGVQFGIPQGTTTNTSVYVTFSGDVGYLIPAGFIVSDGSHQYVVQDGGTIKSTGSTNPLYAVANQSGTWSVPANTVTQLVTSIPSPYSITVTNAVSGVPGGDAETVESYRSRILEANSIAGQGTPSYITSAIKNVPGVQPRLVSIISIPGGWQVICGGGDDYAVAGAIYQSVLDLSTLFGSGVSARNITVSVVDPPNTYSIIYINPPQQDVIVDCVWNTNWINFTGASNVEQLAIPALQNYINAIIVGQPINELEMIKAFQDAVSSIIPSYYITSLTFTVKINGIVTAPSAGTDIIYGDSESYFYAADGNITVTKG